MPLRALLLSLVVVLVSVLGLAAVTACGPTPRGGGGERAARTEQAFTSDVSVLVDFDFDGSLLLTASSDAGADAGAEGGAEGGATATASAEPPDDATLRALIEAQLMYSVGVLNAERSVGRFERLELSQIVRTPSGAVTYHAHLPVAWGASGAPPSSYELRLPARAGEEDQTTFAAKYGTTCVDAETAGAGPIHPARMFLFYRPLRPGCLLETADVVTLSATVTPSSENTTGKYPEWDRIWDDGTLRAVVLFSRAEPVETSGTDDLGVHAFYELMTRATSWARTLGPLAELATQGGNDGWRLSAALVDGRKIVIDARVVGPDLAMESAAFDAWYDARTPDADVIVYSGHAGLGWNVRTLMTKGVFRPGKYLVWVVNGCDTFAYVDRTLAQRRALLNADDEAGTKYLDVVSNVMAAWFETGADTTLTLLDGLTSTPKTYRDIFARIDPSQVIVVTGEEDNVFVPKPSATPSSEPYPKTILPEEPNDDPPPPRASPNEESLTSTAGCASAPSRIGDDAGAALTCALVMLLVARRRASRAR